MSNTAWRSSIKAEFSALKTSMSLHSQLSRILTVPDLLDLSFRPTKVETPVDRMMGKPSEKDLRRFVSFRKKRQSKGFAIEKEIPRTFLKISLRLFQTFWTTTARRIVQNGTMQ